MNRSERRPLSAEVRRHFVAAILQRRPELPRPILEAQSDRFLVWLLARLYRE
jgi:hypothetical protein